MNKTAFARIQNGELDHWAATSGEHGRALGLVGGVARRGMLTGMRGAKVGEWPCDLQALADRGVLPNHDLPYDTDRLRALVQEAAQLWTKTRAIAPSPFTYAPVSRTVNARSRELQFTP